MELKCILILNIISYEILSVPHVQFLYNIANADSLKALNVLCAPKQNKVHTVG